MSVPDEQSNLNLPAAARRPDSRRRGRRGGRGRRPGPRPPAANAPAGDPAAEHSPDSPAHEIAPESAAGEMAGETAIRSNRRQQWKANAQSLSARRRNASCRKGLNARIARTGPNDRNGLPELSATSGWNARRPRNQERRVRVIRISDPPTPRPSARPSNTPRKLPMASRR